MKGKFVPRSESEPVNYVPARRKLRDATVFDRILIGVFFFIIGTLATGALMLRGCSESGAAARRRLKNFESTTEDMTSGQAWIYVLAVCAIGGLGFLIKYIVATLSDPYGTTSDTQEKEQRASNHAKFLEEIGEIQRQRETALGMDAAPLPDESDASKGDSDSESGRPPQS